VAGIDVVRIAVVEINVAGFNDLIEASPWATSSCPAVSRRPSRLPFRSPSWMPSFLHCLRDETASELLELALVTPILVFVFVGAVDFGRAFFVGMEVQSAAEAGATYGITSVQDTAGMQSAAAGNAPDLPGMTSVATYGYECSDGTALVANACANGVVQYVDVSTTTTYQPFLFYPGFQSSFTLTGRSHMRASY
jgi:hypothetical protein